MAKKASTTKNKEKEAPHPHILASYFLGALGKGTRRLRFFRGEFYRWNGRRYSSVSKAELRAMVTRFADEWAHSEASGYPFRITTSLVSNIIQALTGDTLVSEDVDLPAWVEPGGDPEKTFLSFENGLLDLNALLEGAEVILRPATAAWLSTVTLPYKFDPKAQCPRWKTFLEQIFEGDEERICLLQEWFGYLLTPNTTEQKFLVFEGEGSNGKSVVCEVLTAILGEDNVSNVALEVIGERFQLTPTIGKLANIVPEVGELKSVPEGYLKAFTSGDRMYLDRKGLPGIQMRPTARLVLAVNNRPPFHDRSQGLWRRMNLIPFNVTIPEGRQDRNLVPDLKGELPGILNWAVEGERRRRAQHGFTKPRICAEALQEYRLEANPARLFLTEQVEVSPDGTVRIDDLYAAYRAWCTESGCQYLSKQSFGKDVRRQFPKAVREREGTGTRLWFYRGIRMLPSGEESLHSQAA